MRHRLESPAVERDQPAGRRFRFGLVAMAAIGLVVFSWLYPEPKSQHPRLPIGVDQGVSRPDSVEQSVYRQCSATDPNTPQYGDRTLASGCDG